VSAVESLTPAERQTLSFQAILRVYLTAPDHRVDTDVMAQVQVEYERLSRDPKLAEFFEYLARPR
jgi:hypothetical protein